MPGIGDVGLVITTNDNQIRTYEKGKFCARKIHHQWQRHRSGFPQKYSGTLL
jgi:dTDP-glucose pyrophosphorylase